MDRLRATPLRRDATPTHAAQRDPEAAGADPTNGTAWLQRVAGNRAVAELLTGPADAPSLLVAQRDTPPGPTVAERVATADMPSWLVQAFIEQGWTWGGSWGGFLDAMHFDYLGPVADVL